MPKFQIVDTQDGHKPVGKPHATHRRALNASNKLEPEPTVPKKYKSAAGHSHDWRYQIKPVHEEGEAELQELSKKTLYSYISAAGQSAKIANHLSNTEKTFADDSSHDWQKNNHSRWSQMYKNKAQRRVKGLGMASKKLAKEEADLQELSKKTLDSYVDKAMPDIHNAGYRSRGAMGRHDYDAVAKETLHSLKRQGGIKTAIKKMTKEEIENLEPSKVRVMKQLDDLGIMDERERDCFHKGVMFTKGYLKNDIDELEKLRSEEKKVKVIVDQANVIKSVCPHCNENPLWEGFSMCYKCFLGKQKGQTVL